MLHKIEEAALWGHYCKLGAIPQGNTQNLSPFPLDLVDNPSPTISSAEERGAADICDKDPCLPVQ